MLDSSVCSLCMCIPPRVYLHHYLYLPTSSRYISLWESWQETSDTRTLFFAHYTLKLFDICYSRHRGRNLFKTYVFSYKVLWTAMFLVLMRAMISNNGYFVCAKIILKQSCNCVFIPRLSYEYIMFMNKKQMLFCYQLIFERNLTSFKLH